LYVFAYSKSRGDEKVLKFDGPLGPKVLRFDSAFGAEGVVAPAGAEFYNQRTAWDIESIAASF
jgi:hypothetical protein